tara:strand:- start:1759 stop:2004 length:246 start_codon:yes stop_codon:yes gene_type:complete
MIYLSFSKKIEIDFIKIKYRKPETTERCVITNLLARLATANAVANTSNVRPVATNTGVLIADCVMRSVAGRRRDTRIFTGL